MDWQVALLGAFSTLSATGRELLSPDKRSALMAYLAVKASWVRRDELAFLFWPDTDDRSARSNLRQLVMRCKRLPYGSALEITAEAVHWPVETDVRAFNAGIAAQDWFTALRHYQGHLLSSFYLKDDTGGFNAWLELERDTLRLSWQDAAFKAAEALSKTDRSSEAASLLLNVWQLDDYNEGVLQAYLRHAYAAGQKAVALAAFAAFAERLEKTFEIEVSAETQALIQAIRTDTLDTETVTFSAAPAPPKRRLAPLIGRGMALSQLTEILSQSDYRAVVISGQGGVGKTRLALEIAETLHPQLEHGAHVVPLASIRDPEQLISAIAAALSFSFYGPTDPQQQLVNYLRSKTMLLVIDNLEHILTAASTLSELLEAAPHLKLLITSRQLPEIPGLWHYPLMGLGYQTDDSDALTLFVQAAKAQQPQFDLSDANRADAQALCQLVEGLPLALELAASWTGELPVADIFSQIQQNLDFLQRAGAHNSMTAVISHSWQLLSPQQQELLAGLSVFRGGFRREAAEAICNATPYLLLSLQNRSLISRDGGRYNLHELIRQYADTQLSLQARKAATNHYHADYFCNHLKHLYEAIQSNATETLDQVEADLGNVIIAWETLRDQKNFVELDSILDPIVSFYMIRSRFLEGRKLLLRTIDSFNSEQTKDAITLLGRLYLHAGMFAYHLGNLQQAADEKQHSLVLLNQTSKSRYIAVCHHKFGLTLTALGRYAEAQESFNTSLRLHRDLDDLSGISEALNGLGIIHYYQGRLKDAETAFRESLNLRRQLGQQELILSSINNLGLIASAEKRYQDAQHHYQESLELSRNLQHRFGIGVALHNLGSTSMRLRQYHEALSYAEECLKIRRDINDLYLPTTLCLIGICRLNLSDIETAKPYFREACKLALQTQQTPLVLTVMSHYLAVFEEQHKALLVEAAQVISQHPKSPAEARSIAQEYLDVQVSDSHFESTMTLEELAAAVLAV